MILCYKNFRMDDYIQIVVHEIWNTRKTLTVKVCV